MPRLLRDAFLACTLLVLSNQSLSAEQVLISEIMYHPAGDLPEFIEIANITATPFDIARWRLSGAVAFEFPDFQESMPEASFLPAFGRLVIASVDEDTFRDAYRVPLNARVLGPWTGQLANEGERITLRDKNGVILSSVAYDDRGRWPVGADGAGHSLVWADPDAGADDWRNWTLSSRSGGSPGNPEVIPHEEAIPSPEAPLSDERTFVDYGDEWKYQDQNEDLGSEWRAPDYDDSGWASGAGLLGFDEAMLPPPGLQTPLLDGEDEAEHITYYFRREFQYRGEVAGSQLTFDQIVDDGAFFYLNGEPLGGVGVDADADWKTPANRAVDIAQEEPAALVVPDASALLQSGRNVLAVEVHQSDALSSDLVMGVRLRVNAPVASSVLLHEILPEYGESGFIEFYNPTAADIDLNGFFLSDDPANPLKYPITESVIVPASGLGVVGFEDAGFTPSDPLVVYLTNPDGWVIAAIDASISLDGRSVGRKPLGGSEWFLFAAPTPGQPNAGTPPEMSVNVLRMNEVRFDAEGRVDGVELVNISQEMTASLDGLALASTRDFSNRVPLTGTVDPGGFLEVPVTFASDDGDEITLFFVDEKNAVLQGQVFALRPAGSGYQAFPDGGEEWYFDVMGTLGATNAPAIESAIVINEIMCDPPSNSRNGEFVELHNRGGEAVDLSGWAFTEGIRFQFPQGTSLAAGGYLVVAANAEKLSYGMNVIGDYQGSLANTGELLRLEDASGNLADQVDYRTGGYWPGLANGGGSSLELVHPGMDNDFATAWRGSDESAKGEFQLFTYQGVYEELQSAGEQSDFEELHLHLVGDSHIVVRDLSLRFEGLGNNLLLNQERDSVDGTSASGWLAQGNHAGSGIISRELHLVSTGHGDNRANRAELDVPALGPGNDYTLSFRARWVSGKPRLIVQTWDHSFGGTFLVPIPENLGTPGEANSALQAAPAPQVVSILHAPAVPTSSDAVRITAEVAGGGLLEKVEVIHRADSADGEGNWRTTAMNDAGDDGDETADDGVYTATLTNYQSNGQIVQFLVRASDASGASTQLPRLGEARPAMWIVDDEAVPDDLQTHRFVISQYDRNALNTSDGESFRYDWKFPRLSNQYFNMTFISNEEKVIYGGEIRKSGSPFLRSNGNELSKAKWKLPGDQPFRGRIKNAFDDDAADEDARHHNRLTRYWLYLLGHPVNENEFVRVMINGDGAQLRENIEPVSNDFLDRNFPDGTDGELYRIDDEWWFEDDWTRLSRDADWSYKDTDDPLRYHTEYMKRSRETDYDYSSLIAMFKTISADEFTESEIGRIMDPELMAMNAAVRGFAGDWDSITLNRGKNAYLYRKPTDGRFMLLQWDSDLAFADPNEVFIGSLPGIPTYFDKPYIRRRFNHYLSLLVDRFTQGSNRLEAWMDAEDAASESLSVNRELYQEWFDDRNPLASFVMRGTGQRTLDVDGISGSYVTTTAGEFSLEGNANHRVHTIRVADHPEARVTWTGLESWRIDSISLRGGSNPLVIQAVDALGNVVAEHTVFVNRFGLGEPLLVAEADPGSGHVALHEGFRLDASASYDPDGSPLVFDWAVTPAEDVYLANESPTEISAVFTRPGIYTFTATATDSSGASGMGEWQASVYGSGDFSSFSASALDPGLQPVRVNDDASNPAGDWYSLERREGELIIQVLDDRAKPLVFTNPLYPMIQRMIPSGDGWALETELRLDSIPLGVFVTGLVIETDWGASHRTFFFGLGSNTLSVKEGFGGSFTDVEEEDYELSHVALRILQSEAMLHFGYRPSPDVPWRRLASSAVNGGEVTTTGGLMVATAEAQALRVGFDYLMVVDPANVTDLQRSLRVSEIMYHPAQGNAYEFIEWTNTGSLPLSLQGVTLSAGDPVGEVIIGEVTLEPGAFTVVAASAATLRSAYGEQVPVAAEWTAGRLNNGGERIVVRDSEGRVIQDFNYSDGENWPKDADGLGKSLEIIDPLTDYAMAPHWRSSLEFGGTPGGFTLIPTEEDFDGDGLTGIEEEAAGTNPYVADTDGDGSRDGDEIALGTDPLNPSSVFKIVSTVVAEAGDTVTLQWTSSAGKSYDVEISADLTANSWSVVTTVTAAGETSEAVIDLPQDGASGYMRIRLASGE